MSESYMNTDTKLGTRNRGDFHYLDDAYLQVLSLENNPHCKECYVKGLKRIKFSLEEIKKQITVYSEAWTQAS